jgi:hypothetical protein
MAFAIPAGYQITIASWENDNDHWKFIPISGLTKEDVNFIIDLVYEFRYKPNTSGLVTESQLIGRISHALTKHPDIQPWLRAWFYLDNSTTELAEVIDLVRAMGKLLGEEVEGCISDEGWYMRTFDSYTIRRYDTEVPDVTKEFPNKRSN